MKALTIRQPWAWAIFHAGKTIENRSWATRLRGTVAIHAAKGMTDKEYNGAARFIIELTGQSDHFYQASLVRGAILGTVEIVDCVSQSDSPWFMWEYGFVLRNPIVLPEPIPCKGALGFWDVPQDLLSKITVASAV